MKIVLKILLILGVLGYIGFSIVRFRKNPEDSVCKAIDIEMTNDDLSPLVTEPYVQSLLTQGKFSPEGLLLKDVDLMAMEKHLKKDPYIDEVICYFKANSHLCIRVTPLKPVLHVMTGADNYYVDTTGVVMPVGQFNLHLCVATGHIDKKTVKKELIPLAWYIYNDEFWNRQTEQIYVGNDGDITLYPKEGKHRILLGSTENFQEKLANMRLFYEEGFAKVGWNKYKAFDLRFKNQVIGIK